MYDTNGSLTVNLKEAYRREMEQAKRLTTTYWKGKQSPESLKLQRQLLERHKNVAITDKNKLWELLNTGPDSEDEDSVDGPLIVPNESHSSQNDEQMSVLSPRVVPLKPISREQRVEKMLSKAKAEAKAEKKQTKGAKETSTRSKKKKKKKKKSTLR
eukprot:Platyproteum_vivax@DN10653_c0_g1_i1.p2